MNETISCPSVDDLHCFSVGQLTDAEGETIADHLTSCPACLAAIRKLKPRDPLVQVVSVAVRAEHPAPEVDERLITRLCGLARFAVPGCGVETIDVAISESQRGTPFPHGSTVTSQDADEVRRLLAPLQGLDEISRLGNYRLLRVVGRGGMGVVFEAEDVYLKRSVAIKVMCPALASKPQSRERFIREAQAAAAVKHDHVVVIHLVGEEQSTPYLVMEFLAGESLEARLQREGKLPPAEVIRLGRQIAEGLAAAHHRGLIHRDIKPANIWLETLPANAGRSSAGNRVKILDFGLARAIADDAQLTQSGLIVGTPAYLSPEQARSETIDARCDLFSLGALLYRMATGHVPFTGKDTVSILVAVQLREPRPPIELEPDVPPALSALIMKLLSKVTDNRPKSAQEVVQTLKSLETPSAAPPSTANWRHGSHRMVLSAAAIFAVGFLMAGLFFAFRPDPVDPPPGTLPAPSTTSPPTLAAYQGSVDILVWRKTGTLAHKLRLGAPGALPLKPGDQIRVMAHVKPAAFLYLFWIDEEGKAAPVYPWEPNKWGTRPQDEIPLPALELPKQDGQGFTISDGREGMETLVMLALDAPLKATDAELKQALNGLPPQHPVQNANAAVWFENGKVVENDLPRSRLDFTVSDINDPVLRLQEHLSQKLQPLARFSAAVSFARQGTR